MRITLQLLYRPLTVKELSKEIENGGPDEKTIHPNDLYEIELEPMCNPIPVYEKLFHLYKHGNHCPKIENEPIEFNEWMLVPLYTLGYVSETIGEILVNHAKASELMKDKSDEYGKAYFIGLLRGFDRIVRLQEYMITNIEMEQCINDHFWMRLKKDENTKFELTPKEKSFYEGMMFDYSIPGMV